MIQLEEHDELAQPAVAESPLMLNDKQLQKIHEARNKLQVPLSLMELAIKAVGKHCTRFIDDPDSSLNYLPNSVVQQFMTMVASSLIQFNFEMDPQKLLIPMPHLLKVLIQLMNPFVTEINFTLLDGEVSVSREYNALLEHALINCPNINKIQLRTTNIAWPFQEQSLLPVEKFKKSWNNLKSIVSGNEYFCNDDTLKFIQENYPNIQELSISVSALSQTGVDHLKNMKKLHTLHLYATSNAMQPYAHDYIFAVAGEVPSLRNFDFRYAQNHNHFIDHFAQKYPEKELQVKHIMVESGLTEKWPKNLTMRRLEIIGSLLPSDIENLSTIACKIIELNMDCVAAEHMYKLLERIGHLVKSLCIGDVYHWRIYDDIQQSSICLERILALCPNLERFDYNIDKGAEQDDRYNLETAVFKNYQNFSIQEHNDASYKVYKKFLIGTEACEKLEIKNYRQLEILAEVALTHPKSLQKLREVENGPYVFEAMFDSVVLRNTHWNRFCKSILQVLTCCPSLEKVIVVGDQNIVQEIQENRYFATIKAIDPNIIKFHKNSLIFLDDNHQVMIALPPQQRAMPCFGTGYGQLPPLRGDMPPRYMAFLSKNQLIKAREARNETRVPESLIVMCIKAVAKHCTRYIGVPGTTLEILPNTVVQHFLSLIADGLGLRNEFMDSEKLTIPKELLPKFLCQLMNRTITEINTTVFDGFVTDERAVNNILLEHTLKNCPKISKVILRSNKRSDVLPVEWLKNGWNNLRSITVRYNEYVCKESTLKLIQENFPNIEELCINVSEFSQAGVEHLKNMKKLHTLTFSHAPSNCIDCIIAVAGQVASLRTFDFGYGCDISNIFIEQFGLQYPEKELLLTELEVKTGLKGKWPKNLSVGKLEIIGSLNASDIENLSTMECKPFKLRLDCVASDQMYVLLERIGHLVNSLHVGDMFQVRRDVPYVRSPVILERILAACPNVEQFEYETSREVVQDSSYDLPPAAFKNYKSFTICKYREQYTQYAGLEELRKVYEKFVIGTEVCETLELNDFMQLQTVTQVALTHHNSLLKLRKVENELSVLTSLDQEMTNQPALDSWNMFYKCIYELLNCRPKVERVVVTVPVGYYYPSKENRYVATINAIDPAIIRYCQKGGLSRFDPTPFLNFNFNQ